MLVQVVYLEVKPDQLAPFQLEVFANAQASRLESGVAQFDVLQQDGEPLKFMLFEVYYSADALEAHRLTPHFKRWAEKGVPLLSKDRVRVMYQMLE